MEYVINGGRKYKECHSYFLFNFYDTLNVLRHRLYTLRI